MMPPAEDIRPARAPSHVMVGEVDAAVMVEAAATMTDTMAADAADAADTAIVNHINGTCLLVQTGITAGTVLARLAQSILTAVVTVAIDNLFAINTR